MNPPDLPPPRPADLAPLPPGRRVWLMTILVVLPFALVCVPAALVYHFSGRQGTFASWGKRHAEPDVAGLRGSLEQTARKGLPAPDPLDAGPLELRSSPERAAARVEKITRLAQALGGSVAEGLPDGDKRHLYLEVPAGRAAAFRAGVKSGETPSALPPADSSAGKEHLEVIIHTGDE